MGACYAEEEPEELDYPGQVNPKLRSAEDSAKFTQMYAPRGVLHAYASDVDDPTVDPKFGRVGKQKLDELGVADNTIVIYTTDNGNELMLGPDGGYAPFRGEKGTTWEGGRGPQPITPRSINH